MFPDHDHDDALEDETTSWITTTASGIVMYSLRLLGNFMSKHIEQWNQLISIHVSRKCSQRIPEPFLEVHCGTSGATSSAFKHRHTLVGCKRLERTLSVSESSATSQPAGIG